MSGPAEQVMGSRGIRIGLLAFPLVVALALFVWRGVDHYGPTKDFGGEEPAASHTAALHLLDHGTVDRPDYPPGFSYFVASVYVFLPNDPRSVIAVQIALLVLVAHLITKLASVLCDARAAGAARVLVAAYVPLAYFSVVFSGVYIGFVIATAALFVAATCAQVFSWRRAFALAALAGLLSVVRPDYVLLVPAASIAVWLTQGTRRGVAVTALVVAFTILSVAGSNALNPPRSGWMHGGHYAARSMLLGTYQFEDRWWDWRFVLRSDAPQDIAARDALAELEARVGKPFGSPELEEATRALAVERLRSDPASTAKKLLVGGVRFWTFVPQQFEGRWIAKAITALELCLFAIAVAGAALLWRRRSAAGLFLVLSGCAAAATHVIVYVEARHSLPARAIELVAAAVALEALWRRFSPLARYSATPPPAPVPAPAPDSP